MIGGNHILRQRRQALLVLRFEVSLRIQPCDSPGKLVCDILREGFRILRDCDLSEIYMVADVFPFIAFPVQVPGPVNHTVHNDVAFDHLQVFIRIQPAERRQILRGQHVVPVKGRKPHCLFDVCEQGNPAAGFRQFLPRPGIG